MGEVLLEERMLAREHLEIRLLDELDALRLHVEAFGRALHRDLSEPAG